MRIRPVPTAVVFAVLVGLAGSAFAAAPSVGSTVEPFRLRTVNAQEAGVNYVGLLDHVGATPKAPKKVVLLSFFATYCGPCKKEMPFLAALDREYRDKGLLVMSITIDKESDKIDEAKELAKKSDVAFPVLSDRFNIVAKRWGIEKLPCVYMIDAQGKVMLKKVGYKGQVTKELLEAVRKGLGEATDAPVPEALAKYMKH